VPACHDTASAIAAIPAAGDDWAFISSGTWSLVGTVVPKPCVTDEARKLNFTNLGGVGGSICFLKNVNGMWLLHQCMDYWEKAGYVWSLNALLRHCEQLPAPEQLIDVDDPQLMVPGDLPGAINGQLSGAGCATLPIDNRGIPQMANLIFHSLAQRYAQVLDSVSRVTGKKLKRLFVVGGGAKNAFLNRLTAERTGVVVEAGCTEASTVGNFAVQLARLNASAAASSGVSAADVAKYAEILSCSFSPVSVE
jgi:rhamnulokinase